jgi:dolichol-phosphate mannosyltransferase
MDISTQDCQVSIIIPTYREAENLPILIPRIAAALSTGNLTGEIVIVDDDSQDGTEKVCAELSASHPVRLAVRTTERGLSSAVLHGMRMARGNVFVVMDADLSHPAEEIPNLVQTLLTQDADFVIGSRYVAGAGTDENWGWFRWLNSKVATLMAWPLTSAADPMAGFFAIRRSTFEAAAPLDPIGYKIGLELIVKCNCRAIKEVPITFRDRVHGESKLTLKEQINYLRHLMKLYQSKYQWKFQLAKFCLVGGTGAVIDLLSFTLLLLSLPSGIARALAIALAMTWNFVLNYQVTFAASSNRPVWLLYLLFCLSCSLGAVVNWSVSMFLIEMNGEFFATWPTLAAAVGIVCGTAFNFLCSKFLVFK